MFKGLREDLQVIPAKPPSPSKRRLEGQHGVPRENILQLLPDAVAPSREELMGYWRRVADRALIHLGRRPLKLVRHAQGATFYHKGPLPPIPGPVHQLRVQKREGGEGVRVWVDGLDGLLGLVEMDAVELHPWNATIDDIEHADQLVLDLDPGEGVPWDAVIETALSVRHIMEAAGLRSWPKVTGGKGIHLTAPLASGVTHDRARQLAKSLAQCLIDAKPDRYLLSADPAARLVAFSSTIFATGAAILQSVRSRHERGPAFLLPILSHGRRSSGESGRTPSPSTIHSGLLFERQRSEKPLNLRRSVHPSGSEGEQPRGPNHFKTSAHFDADVRLRKAIRTGVQPCTQ